MNHPKKKNQVFQIQCPGCHSILWIDSVTKKVLKFEKEARKKGSLEELLLNEQRKAEELDRKFKATAELEKERRKEALAKFRKGLLDIDKKEND